MSKLLKFKNNKWDIEIPSKIYVINSPFGIFNNQVIELTMVKDLIHEDEVMFVTNTGYIYTLYGISLIKYENYDRVKDLLIFL